MVYIGSVKAERDDLGSDGIPVMLLESVGSMLGANAAMDKGAVALTS